MDEYKLIARCRVGAAYGQTISVSSAAAFGPSTATRCVTNWTRIDLAAVAGVENLDL
jgi:hypothetical protein